MNKLNTQNLRQGIAILCLGITGIACNAEPAKDNTPDTSVPQTDNQPTSKAAQDVAKALENGDYRLFLVASRNPSLPGLDEAIDLVKERCGTQYIEGGTDVVRTREDREKQKALRAYAEEYNQLMWEHCKNRSS